MARFLRMIGGYNQPTTEIYNVAASQTIAIGDLVQLNATSRKIEAAVAGSTTIVGIATEAITTGGSVTAADKIPVLSVRGAVIRMPYTGSTKTSLAESDLYTTKFDLSNKTTINLDDTTGGMCQVVAYDNDKDTADVVIASANIILG